MQADPRSKNKTFSMESPGAYLKEYVQSLSQTLDHVTNEPLAKTVSLLTQTLKTGKRIYVCGNGGSSAIADHLCCDWTKGTYTPGKPALKTQSLSANGALMTALANDYGYEVTFSTQVEMFCEAGDVLVAISSSGNSPNIVKACEAARAKGMQIVGLSGFSGGKLSELAHISMHTPFSNYGLVEDCHQILMHVISQYLVRAIES